MELLDFQALLDEFDNQLAQLLAFTHEEANEIREYRSTGEKLGASSSLLYR